jgi:hypothetical protein
VLATVLNRKLARNPTHCHSVQGGATETVAAKIFGAVRVEHSLAQASVDPAYYKKAIGADAESSLAYEVCKPGQKAVHR